MLFLTTMVHSSQFLVHGVRGGLWLILFALGSSLSTAKAQTGLQIQLVSEQTAIVPGKPFTVGLWLDHDRGWHTYWRFPGIVGVPTQLKWNLPKGWKAGELVYPEPERTLMFKIKAQGFDRDVMLRTELTPPANLKIGDQITLTGKASWMCCGNTCHPGSMDLSLTLPVAETAELNSKWHKLLNEERARVEQTSDAWTAAAIEKGDTITLSLKPATAEARLPKNQREADKIIVFTEDGWFDTDKPQIIQRHDDGSLTISLIKADAYLGDKPPKTLRAIVRNDDGWLQDGRLRCLQIAPRIQRGG
jgi:DsbC/DsbD-like thiol-disulfide interchange protein